MSVLLLCEILDNNIILVEIICNIYLFIIGAVIFYYYCGNAVQCESASLSGGYKLISYNITLWLVS